MQARILGGMGGGVRSGGNTGATAGILESGTGSSGRWSGL